MGKTRQQSRPRRHLAPGPVIVAGPEAEKHLRKIAAAQARMARQALPERESWWFRFRFQLMPLGWLGGLAGAAAAGRVHVPWVMVALAGAVVVVMAVAATRHRDGIGRWYPQAMASWAGLWAVPLWAWGLGWWAAIALVGWAVPSGLWVEKHRWRPKGPAPAAGPSVEERWTRLAERKKWTAWLVPRGPVEGGAKWEIVCDGAQTSIGKILPDRDDVAAAFHAAITEAYAEPHEDGKRHHGVLTILRTGTLEQVREWDGGTIDPETGMAVAGRFPDGKPVHEVYFNLPEDGVKHTVISGADGSGKTATINLGLAISATSGLVAPVILDPQEGQALPDWRDRVPYACGVEECLTWLRGLHAGLFARSAQLANLDWTDAKGRRRHGMGFYNPYLLAELGLDVPIVEITLDEAPVLLAIRGVPELVLGMAKLGRKCGFRWRLAAQVPSLAELKAQELRSLLAGGNVFCHRTGDKVTAGYVNIPANPNELPKRFSNGKPTYGLGFADGPDMRPGVTMRTDFLADPFGVARQMPIRPLDAVVDGCLQASIEKAARLAAQARGGAAALSDAQGQVLAALAAPLGMGELIVAVDLKVTEVVAAVDALEKDGRVRRAGELLEAVPG